MKVLDFPFLLLTVIPLLITTRVFWPSYDRSTSVVYAIVNKYEISLVGCVDSWLDMA